MVLVVNPTIIEIEPPDRPNRNSQVLAARVDVSFELTRDFTVEFAGVDDIIRAIPNFGTLQFRVNDNGQNGWSELQQVLTSEGIYFSPNLGLGVTNIFVWPRLGASLDVTFGVVDK